MNSHSINTKQHNRQYIYIYALRINNYKAVSSNLPEFGKGLTSTHEIQLNCNSEQCVTESQINGLHLNTLWVQKNRKMKSMCALATGRTPRGGSASWAYRKESIWTR